MKLKFASAIMVLLTAGLFLFQNCAKSDSADSREVSVEQTPTTEKVVVQDTFNVSAKAEDAKTLTVPAADYNVFVSSGGRCKWTFTSPGGAVENVPSTSNVVSFAHVKPYHFGTYTLHCENETLVHDFIFKLTQIPTPTPPTPTPPTPTPVTPKDKYLGQFIVNGQVEGTFASLDSITEAGALDKCKATDMANPKKGIRCTWGSKVILNRAEPTNKLVGQFKVGNTSTVFIELDNQTESLALSRCKAEADKSENVRKGVECKWGSKVIFSRAEILTAKFIGKFKYNDSTIVFAEFDGLTEGESLAKCKAEADKSGNKKKGVLCKWGDKKLFERAEIPEKRDGKLYVNGDHKKTIKNLTHSQAVDKCEDGKKAFSKKYTIKCVWGSEVLYNGPGTK